MKKTLKRILTAVIAVLALSLCVLSASAADCTQRADALYELGLFRGTDKGYELDSGSTRAQSAAMLVRLLGKEAEAEEGEYVHPFADSVEWADKYIGYMYETGLTKGISADSFAPDAPCTARMYTTFVLRALGYTEGAGDFTYEEAESFAAGLGLPVTDGDFTRDDMVLISYAALFRSVKGEDTLLLEKLVKDGAVAEEAAAVYLEKYAVYREMDGARLGEGNLRMKMSVSSDVSISGLTVSTEQEDEYTVETDGESVKMKIDSLTRTPYAESSQTVYYNDGWLYIVTPDGNFKAQLQEDGFEQLLDYIDVPAYQEPFYAVNSISGAKTDAGYEYDVVYDAAVSGLKDALAPFLSAEGFAADLRRDVDIRVAVDKSGSLTSVCLLCGCSFASADGVELGQADVSIRLDFLESGSGVRVILPDDLDSYTELAGLLG